MIAGLLKMIFSPFHAQKEFKSAEQLAEVNCWAQTVEVHN